jgi:hypothetical protein
MTIMFHKSKRSIQSDRRSLLSGLEKAGKGIPKFEKKKWKNDMAFHRKALKIVKVRVVDSKKLDSAGGRKIGGKGYTIKRGEVGYVYNWKGMGKEAGLQRVKR